MVAYFLLACLALLDDDDDCCFGFVVVRFPRSFVRSFVFVCCRTVGEITGELRLSRRSES